MEVASGEGLFAAICAGVNDPGDFDQIVIDLAIDDLVLTGEKIPAFAASEHDADSHAWKPGQLVTGIDKRIDIMCRLTQPPVLACVFGNLAHIVQRQLGKAESFQSSATRFTNSFFSCIRAVRPSTVWPASNWSKPSWIAALIFGS